MTTDGRPVMVGGYATWRGGRDPVAGVVWAAVRAAVRDAMTRGNWAVYFERSRGLALTEDRGRVTLVVGAPNSMAADGLDTLFARHVRRALDAQGDRALAVRVVLLPTRTLPGGEDVVDVDGADDTGAPAAVRPVAAP